MNKRLSFITEAWDEYLYWQTQDKKTLKRINNLLRDIRYRNFLIYNDVPVGAVPNLLTIFTTRHLLGR